MDWSDEKYDMYPGDCVELPLATYCDDHTCPENWWSCGDGACIHHFNRYVYQTIYVGAENCFSRREFNYMCELAAHLSLWTKADGLWC